MDQPPSPAEAAAPTPQEKTKQASNKSNRLLMAAALAVVPAFIALRVWVEAYNIPSGAMFPTLQIGDHIFATRHAWFGTPEPRRGELVVFRYPDPNPNNDPVDFVKRVIALPGDELELDAGHPIINGQRLPHCSLGKAQMVLGEERQELELFVEFLENSSYLVALDPERPARREGPYTVPAGEFYVLGDNRDNSSDSRTWNGGKGGGVPFEELGRRGTWVWLSNDGPTLRDLNGAPKLLKSLSHLQVALDRCLAKAPSVAERTPRAPVVR